MDENGKSIAVELVKLTDVAEAMRRTRPFAEVDPLAALGGLEQVEKVRAKAGTILLEPGERWHHYWLVLEGETRAERQEADGSWSQLGSARVGNGFGETQLLTGRAQKPFRMVAAKDSVFVRLQAQEFWNLMSCCEAAREVILADMAQRLQAHQVEALHREKLVSLGVMAAGLMHELHNPGTAAKRAAAQMRENLLRLQKLSLQNAGKGPRSPEQLDCLRGLIERIFGGCRITCMSSIEQADAEEAMMEWLAKEGVNNAHTLAPALVAAGLDQDELACARATFQDQAFADAMNWLEALVSNVTLVSTIEESIGRMSDLVMAVKKFAYDDRGAGKELDVHESLQSALTILGHKLRMKDLTLEKRFEASPAKIVVRGPALSQVWTNLIDNAVDASPMNSTIRIETWNEPGALGISIEDHGTGIEPDILPHIFEPFFTTKPQGSGTGLGLEIVHRIVTQNLGGTVEVESEPGRTRFMVRLPVNGTGQA